MLSISSRQCGCASVGSTVEGLPHQNFLPSRSCMGPGRVPSSASVTASLRAGAALGVCEGAGLGCAQAACTCLHPPHARELGTSSSG